VQTLTRTARNIYFGKIWHLN